MRQVRVRAAHEVPDRPPLQLAVGDSVEVREQSVQWPAFVFVVAAQGTGWVPLRYVSESYVRGRCVVQNAYDTTELATRAGEVLRVIEEDVESGWLWCRSRAGAEDWVPVNTIEEIA